MSTIRLRQLLPVCLLVLLLTGCGYQLRGTTPLLPPDISPIRVQGLPAYDRFRTQVEQGLAAAGAEIAADSGSARGLLRIHERSHRRRVLTVNSDIRAQEYELLESIRFSFRTQPAGRSIAEQEINARRIFDQQLNKGTREERELREEMRADLVRRMINRIGAQL